MVRRVVTYLPAAIAAFCGSAVAQADAPRALDPALPAYTAQAVAPDRAAGYVTSDGAVRLGGAEHVAYIVERVNAAFGKAHPGIRFAVDGKGTSSAVPLLTHDRILFGAMGRAINPIERIPYRKIVGREPVEIAIAHTAGTTQGGLATTLAVYVNRANPLQQISLQQLAQVLTIGNPAGDYSHWGQLGLQGEWQQRAIHPYGTAPYTGFGDYLQQAHLARRALAPQHEEASNTTKILARIGTDPAGIGVAAIGETDPQVRQLAIVAPDGTVTRGTPADVANGSYPLARDVYVYLRREAGKPLDPLAREYLRFLLSREGQAIVAAQPGGYIPLSAAEAATERAKLDAPD